MSALVYVRIMACPMQIDLGAGLYVLYINTPWSLIRCRTPTGATATLLMSPMIPFLLIPWAIGNKKRKTKRCEKLQSATEWFNAEHPGLFMKFETRPRKRLLIMRRDDARRLEIDE